MKYFIPYYQHWYMHMVQYPTGYRYFGTALILMAISAVWYLVLYKPLQCSIDRYRRINTTLAAQIKEQEKAQQVCIMLSKSIKEMERELRDVYNTQIKTHDLMACIVKQACKNSLHCVTCSTEPSVSHGWYQEEPIIVEFLGALPTVPQWISAIADNTRLMSVQGINLAMTNPNLFQCHATISSLMISS